MDQPLSSPASSDASRPAAGWPWLSALSRPLRAFRSIYLPLMMVYFAYGASGIIDVTRDMWIKERLTLVPGRPRRNWRVAQPALDCKDGIWRVGRQRADLRLAAQSLCPDRRDGHGQRHARTLAGTAGGWIAFAEPTTSMCSARADHRRHGDSERCRRSDVDRGRLASRRRRERTTRRRRTGRPRHGSGARSPRAVCRHVGGGRTFRLAGKLPRSRNRLPLGVDRPAPFR